MQLSPRAPCAEKRLALRVVSVDDVYAPISKQNGASTANADTVPGGEQSASATDPRLLQLRERHDGDTIDATSAPPPPPPPLPPRTVEVLVETTTIVESSCDKTRLDGASPLKLTEVRACSFCQYLPDVLVQRWWRAREECRDE